MLNSWVLYRGGQSPVQGRGKLRNTTEGGGNFEELAEALRIVEEIKVRKTLRKKEFGANVVWELATHSTWMIHQRKNNDFIKNTCTYKSYIKH